MSDVKLSLYIFCVILIAMLMASMVKNRRRYEEQVERLEKIERRVNELMDKVGTMQAGG